MTVRVPRSVAEALLLRHALVLAFGAWLTPRYPDDPCYTVVVLPDHDEIGRVDWPTAGIFELGIGPPDLVRPLPPDLPEVEGWGWLEERSGQVTARYRLAAQAGADSQRMRSVDERPLIDWGAARAARATRPPPDLPTESD